MEYEGLADNLFAPFTEKTGLITICVLHEENELDV